MNRASRIKLARELLYCAKIVLDANQIRKAMSPRRLTKDQFISKAQKIFGDKYDYSHVEYKNNRIPVKIICTQHNEQFFQRPKDHLYGYCKCPKCQKRSNGEMMFAQLLKRNNIHFNVNKSFYPEQYLVDEIKRIYGFDITFAPYDFEIPSKHILVEIQGEQHWDAKALEGLSRGRQTIQQRMRIDQGKKYFAEKVGYTVIQIPHARKTVIERIPENLKQCYVSLQEAIEMILGTN